MDKMRMEVKGKLNYWRKVSALFFILWLLNTANIFKPASGGDNYIDFFAGFQLGIALAVLICAIKNICTYRNILKDDEKIKSFYIKAHDERNVAIYTKTGGTPLATCGILIIGAAIVSGYFSITVFVTLLICGFLLLLFRKGLYIYYSKTM